MKWNVYLSGEIHSSWREEIAKATERLNLPITLTASVTDHSASDNCGTELLGSESEPFWKDHKAAKINAIRTRTLIRHADIVVIRFGETYRQWNAAFEAGYACALGKPLITLHEENLSHALKEVDAAAQAVAQTPQQVANILEYLLNDITIAAGSSA